MRERERAMLVNLGVSAAQVLVSREREMTKSTEKPRGMNRRAHDFGLNPFVNSSEYI